MVKFVPTTEFLAAPQELLILRKREEHWRELVEILQLSLAALSISSGQSMVYSKDAAREAELRAILGVGGVE